MAAQLVSSVGYPEDCPAYATGYNPSGPDCNPDLKFVLFFSWCPSTVPQGYSTINEAQQLELFLHQYFNFYNHNMGMRPALIQCQYALAFNAEKCPHSEVYAFDLKTQTLPGEYPYDAPCSSETVIPIIIVRGTDYLTVPKEVDFDAIPSLNICIGLECLDEGHPTWDLQVDSIEEIPVATNDVYNFATTQYCLKRNAIPLVTWENPDKPSVAPGENAELQSGTHKCKCYCAEGYEWVYGQCVKKQSSRKICECPWNKCFALTIGDSENCPKNDIFPGIEVPFPLDNNLAQFYTIDSTEEYYVKITARKYVAPGGDLNKVTDATGSKSKTWVWKDFLMDPQGEINGFTNGFLDGFGAYYLEMEISDGSHKDFCTAEIMLQDEREPVFESCATSSDKSSPIPYTEPNYNSVKDKADDLDTIIDDTCDGSFAYHEQFPIKTSLVDNGYTLTTILSTDHGKFNDKDSAPHLCADFSEDQKNALVYGTLPENKAGEILSNPEPYPNLLKCCEVVHDVESEFNQFTCPATDPVKGWSARYSEACTDDFPKISCKFENCFSVDLEGDFVLHSFTGASDDTDNAVEATHGSGTENQPDDFAGTEVLQYEVFCHEVKDGSEDIGDCFVEPNLRDIVTFTTSWMDKNYVHSLESLCDGEDPYKCGIVNVRYKVVNGGYPSTWIKHNPDGDNKVKLAAENPRLIVELWTKTGREGRYERNLRVHPHVPFDPCYSMDKYGIRPDLDLSRKNGDVICNIPSTDFSVIELNWESEYGQEHMDDHIPLKSITCRAKYEDSESYESIKKFDFGKEYDGSSISSFGGVEIFKSNDYYDDTPEAQSILASNPRIVNRKVKHYSFQLHEEKTFVDFQCELVYASGFETTCRMSREFSDCDAPFFCGEGQCSVDCLKDVFGGVQPGPFPNPSSYNKETVLANQVCEGNRLRYLDGTTVYDTIDDSDINCCAHCGTTTCTPLVDSSDPLEISKCEIQYPDHYYLTEVFLRTFGMAHPPPHPTVIAVSAGVFAVVAALVVGAVVMVKRANKREVVGSETDHYEQLLS